MRKWELLPCGNVISISFILQVNIFNASIFKSPQDKQLKLEYSVLRVHQQGNDLPLLFSY